MKITKKRLKEIVSEELKRGLKEVEGAEDTPEMKKARNQVELTLDLMQKNPRVAALLVQIRENPMMKSQFLAKINGLMDIGVKDVAGQTQKTSAQQRALGIQKAPEDPGVSGVPSPARR